jgi:hypothetical protein
VRSTDPKLQHPTDPKLLRQFTPGEHARIKGVPERLVDGVSATVAHQILGQGVVYPPFVGVGQHLGESLDAAAGRRPTRPSAAVVRDDDAALSAEVRLASLAAEVVAELKMPNVASSTYIGRVVAAAGVLVSTSASAVRPIPGACQSDAASLCPGLVPGDHKFGKCMKSHEARVSQACKEAWRAEHHEGEHHGGVDQMPGTPVPQPVPQQRPGATQ